MLVVLWLILFQLLCILKECESLYVGDSYNRMKLKILQMDRDLVLNAIRDVERVQHFKELYQLSATYDIGDILYKIKSKFARMSRLLIISYEKLDLVWHNNHIELLSEIQKLSMDIYAMAEILEDWEASGKILTTIKRPRRPTNYSKTWSKPQGGKNVRHLTSSILGTTKANLRKKVLNYEGFDSDVN